MKLSDQVILLTGGAGAVGKHLLENLRADASEIVLVDVDADALAEVRASFPDVACYECDLTRPDAVAAFVARVHDDGHQVTVLINNAGSIHSEPLINLLSRTNKRHSIDAWQQAIDVNLNSVFYVTSCVAEHMVSSRTKGLIVNVSSISASGNAGQSAYAAAKAAVNSLTVTWSKELGMFGIRSVAIAPGFLDTSSTHAALSEANVGKWTRQTPLRRLGAPDEMAQAIRFVIENDFYNGRVLELDGGLRI